MKQRRLRFISSSVVIFFFCGATAFGGSYPIVDTGQDQCFDNISPISQPAEGEDFYGQDAQFNGNQPGYAVSDDGFTVYDTVTGLTWTQSPDIDGDGDIDSDDKMSASEVAAYVDSLNDQAYGGYDDWRLPTIKELYSLMDFRGTDLMSEDTSDAVPFIDTDYFDFEYGDTGAGERVIDAQYWSGNDYVAYVFGWQEAVFGLNLADGRIKGYRLDGSKRVHLVRGNTDYGINAFTDNGDGTVTDSATSLMWARDDSGEGMDWQTALAWVQERNAANYLGYSDWRLPNAKEMQSIVDYSRAPDATDSAAIDPVFNITAITNKGGETDYPWFWTGTTHSRMGGNGAAAVYICFGRAMGYVDGWLDVHGAGAQRSDDKTGEFSHYTYVDDGYYNAISPQGDAARIYNFARLVRDAADETGDKSPDAPDAVSLTSPSGTVDDTTPAYTWTADDTATWYKLFVWDSGLSTVISQWYEADAVCSDGSCSVESGETLDYGTYEWFVKSWNDEGKVWSDGMSFTVETP